MQYNTTTVVQPCGQLAALRPLLRLIGDMLAECGYPVMTAAFLDVLSADLALLAALQRLAFHRLAQAQGGCICQ